MTIRFMLMTGQSIATLKGYAKSSKSSTMISMSSKRSTALDTAIVADIPVGTANAQQMSAKGILSGGAIAATDQFMMLLVEMDAFDAALSEDKWFLGLEIEYTPLYGGLLIDAEGISSSNV